MVVYAKNFMQVLNVTVIIVIMPFPFSDLSSTKKRPALIVANLHGDDVILCQITSKKVNDNLSCRSMSFYSKIDLSARQINTPYWTSFEPIILFIIV